MEPLKQMLPFEYVDILGNHVDADKIIMSAGYTITNQPTLIGKPVYPAAYSNRVIMARYGLKGRKEYSLNYTYPKKGTAAVTIHPKHIEEYNKFENPKVYLVVTKIYQTNWEVVLCYIDEA